MDFIVFHAYGEFSSMCIGALVKLVELRFSTLTDSDSVNTKQPRTRFNFFIVLFFMIYLPINLNHQITINIFHIE